MTHDYPQIANRTHSPRYHQGGRQAAANSVSVKLVNPRSPQQNPGRGLPGSYRGQLMSSKHRRTVYASVEAY